MIRPLMRNLEKLCAEAGSPAAAGVVVSRNAVLDQAAVGVRCNGNPAPVTIHDRFHAGSNTKAMTAATCAALVNSGQLSWSLTPLDVFPDLAGSILPGYRDVTLEMLLRHMAGIPPFTEENATDFAIPNWKGIPPERHIHEFSRWLLQKRKPVNQPGTAFSYSNAGYSIAAAMAEVVTGKTWNSLIEENLFRPLGIDARVGCGWPARYDPDQPWGHFLKNGELSPQPPDDIYQPESFLAPAGDISISLPDYGRFLQMNLKGLYGEETILPAALIRSLHNDCQPGNGMGWRVKTLQSIEHVGLFSTHAGSGATFLFVSGISLERDRALAIATNSANPKKTILWFKKLIAQYVRAA